MCRCDSVCKCVQLWPVHLPSATSCRKESQIFLRVCHDWLRPRGTPRSFCVAHCLIPSQCTILFCRRFTWHSHAGGHANGSHFMRRAIEHLVCVPYNESANDVARVLHGSAVVEHNDLPSKKGLLTHAKSHAHKHDAEIYCMC